MPVKACLQYIMYSYSTQLSGSVFSHNKSPVFKGKNKYDVWVEVRETLEEHIGVEMPTREEVEEVLKELDENGDGKLSLEEF